VASKRKTDTQTCSPMKRVAKEEGRAWSIVIVAFCAFLAWKMVTL
jgi:hypothetical protein